MIRVAVLSDIHANLDALEAVWEDVLEQGVDRVFHLGDLVGYNPYPVECVEFVRTHNLPGIAGNYDLAVISDEPDPVGLYLKKSISPDGLGAYEWTRSRITPECRDFLGGLPQRLEVQLEGHHLTLVHGSPFSVREYLTPDTPPARLNLMVKASGGDVLVCGHTHLPMIRQTGSGLLINPGSVGKPKDGNPRAGYLVLELAPEKVAPRIRRVEYPVAETAALIRQVGLPEAQADSLLRGLSA
jgi:putative phosphoesterase